MTGFRSIRPEIREDGVRATGIGRSMAGRSLLLRETTVELQSESADSGTCISNQIGWSMRGSLRGSLAGTRSQAVGMEDAPDSRAMVTECTTVLIDGQISFGSSTWLVSG
jgi:hypothetical protein